MTLREKLAQQAAKILGHTQNAIAKNKEKVLKKPEEIDPNSFDGYYYEEGSGYYFGKKGNSSKVRVVKKGFPRRLDPTIENILKFPESIILLQTNDKGKVRDITHNEFLDRIHWHYGEHGGFLPTKYFLAWSIHLFANREGENDMYQKVMSAVLNNVVIRGKAHFFGGNAGDNYDYFTAVKNKFISANGQHPMYAISNDRKDGVKNSVESTISALLGNNNPYINISSPFFLDAPEKIPRAWSRGLDDARQREPIGGEVIGFEWLTEGGFPAKSYFHIYETLLPSKAGAIIYEYDTKGEKILNTRIYPEEDREIRE